MRHRNPGAAVITAALLGLGGSSAATAAEARPNLLLIYSDDHGWADLGVQGADPDIRTPNLDQLARDGVRFTRGYVTAPQCVPSRAGVLTGRYQQRFGVDDNQKGPLPLAEVTLAERLKTAGYRTGMAGKWHLDLVGGKGAKSELREQKEFLPHAQGFDEYWCGAMRRYHASHDLKGRVLPDAPQVVTDSRFRVVVQTEAALSFLDRRAAEPGRPWFFYLAWFAPHVPLESPEPWFSRTPAHLPRERRQALAMIAAMDDGLGRIRAKLRAMNAVTNTLIFFISDNGAPLGTAWDGSLNLPMIGQKGMLSEGGIRVPFVAAWPGRIPAGQVYEQPVISLDVAATANALAGLPAAPALDGVNLLPYLTGATRAAPHDTLYWRWSSQAAVLEMPYKLILLGEREKLLFDVTTPDGENTARNLVAAKPDVAARLETKLRAWASGLHSPGMAAALDTHHEDLFTEHGLLAGSVASMATPADPLQGWIARNAVLAVKDGALVLDSSTNAGPNARAFLTHSDLDLPGPVTVILQVRAESGGPSSFAWRMKQQADFAPGNTASFEWPTTAEWREVRVELPVQGRLHHLRINPGRTVRGLAIRSIELRGAAGEARAWRFDAARL